MCRRRWRKAGLLDEAAECKSYCMNPPREGRQKIIQKGQTCRRWKLVHRIGTTVHCCWADVKVFVCARQADVTKHRDVKGLSICELLLRLKTAYGCCYTGDGPAAAAINYTVRSCKTQVLRRHTGIFACHTSLLLIHNDLPLRRTPLPNGFELPAILMAMPAGTSRNGV